MLRLWGRTTSSNVQKVMWLCAELALPHERIDAGGPFGRTQDPAYLALNPNGLVPTIEDDDFVLWESNTILRYLANRHGAHAWYPVEPRARAQVEKWMDWSSTTFGPALFNAFWQLVRTPPEQRDAGEIAESVRKTATVLRIADAQLAARAFLCADAGRRLHRRQRVSLVRAADRAARAPGAARLVRPAGAAPAVSRRGDDPDPLSFVSISGAPAAARVVAAAWPARPDAQGA